MTIRFTKDHEYVRVEGDTAIVGISDYAQAQLGDVVYVELPDVGKKVAQGGIRSLCAGFRRDHRGKYRIARYAGESE
jgi:hypothetical protein